MTNLDTGLGFKFAGTFYGGPNAAPIYKDFYFKDTETLTKGDVLNLESGEVDLAATDDTAFIGVAAETVAGTDSTTQIRVIVNPDAVWSVYDPNARAIGAQLDITGTTGQMTVATDSNHDVYVCGGLGADERTLVRFVPAEQAWV